MTVLSKERLLNYKKYLLLLLLLLSLFISYFFISGLYEIIFQYDFDGPEAGSIEEQKWLIDMRWEIHEFMYITNCMVMIAPLITFTFAIFFFKEKKAVFQQRFIRGQSPKKVIISSLLSHSFFVALGFYAVYMIYLTIGWFTVNITPSQIPLNTFDAIFGNNFAVDHLYLYFTICGFYRAFMAAFIYSLLACSICLVVQKAYQAILYSCIYYYGLTMLCSHIPLNREVFHAVQPAMIQGFVSYVYEPVLVWDAFSPLVTLAIPALISAGIVIYTLRRGEKLEN